MASINVSALRPRFLLVETWASSNPSNVFRIAQSECQLVILSIGNVLSLFDLFNCIYKLLRDCFNFALPFPLHNDLPCHWVQPCPMREQPEPGPVGQSHVCGVIPASISLSSNALHFGMAV